MKLGFSLRYMVLGIYKDRDSNVWRIYPWFFTRMSFGVSKTD
jgi:hypothetical protein